MNWNVKEEDYLTIYFPSSKRNS